MSETTDMYIHRDDDQEQTFLTEETDDFYH